MKKAMKIILLGSALVLAGCTVRSYPLTRERVDQSMTEGNRGYLMGQPQTAITPSERKETRTVQVVEVELGMPFGKKGKAVQQAEVKPAPEMEQDLAIEGNRGYIEQEPAPETKYETYTVKKNDTLQKISMQYYDTTKKWIKIYNANKDTLKSPDRLYPGKTIRIPMDGIKKQKEPAVAPAENLK